MDRLQVFGGTLNIILRMSLGCASWSGEGGQDTVFDSLSKGFTALRKVKNIQGGVYKVGISTWREPAVEKS